MHNLEPCLQQASTLPLIDTFILIPDRYIHVMFPGDVGIVDQKIHTLRIVPELRVIW